MDVYIKRELKSWSDHHQPPANAKARLLLVAAADCGPVDTNAQVIKLRESSSSLASDLRFDRPFEPANHGWFWIMHLGLHPIRQVA